MNFESLLSFIGNYAKDVHVIEKFGMRAIRATIDGETISIVNARDNMALWSISNSGWEIWNLESNTNPVGFDTVQHLRVLIANRRFNITR